MKLLIVADTHGLHTEQLLDILRKEKADINIHAGDYLLPINEMQKMFQYFVDGNNDYGHNDEQTFIVNNYKFLLTHGDKYFNFNYKRWIENAKIEMNQFDVIIFGHSHIPVIDTDKKPYFINPGSFSLPRSGNKRTYITAKIDNNQTSFKINFLN